jgi:hypothetical protein
MLIISVQAFYIFLLILASSSKLMSRGYAALATGIIVYISYILITGLRWNTGTDWTPYLNAFKEIKYLDNAGLWLSFEPGYIGLVALIDLIFGDYTYLLIAISVIIVFSIHKAAKIGNIPGFTVLIVLLLIQSQFYYPVRQQIAVALSLYAIVFYLEKPDCRLLRFVGILGIGALFHVSALFSLFAIILNVRIAKMHIIAMGVILFIVGSLIEPYLIAFFDSRIDSYLIINEYEFSNMRTYFRLFERFFSLLILFSILNKLVDQKFYFGFNFNISIFIFVGMLLSTVTLIYYPFLARLTVYFSSLEAYLVACMVMRRQSIPVSASLRLIPYFLLISIKFVVSLSSYWDLISPYNFIFELTQRGEDDLY